MKVASFEKLKSDLNQTWFIDITCEPSYVHATLTLTCEAAINKNWGKGGGTQLFFS